MKIKIDEKEYDTEEMSSDAIAQLRSLQFTDGEIAKTQMTLAALQTARNTYGRALRSLLEGDGQTTDEESNIDLPDNLSFD